MANQPWRIGINVKSGENKPMKNGGGVRQSIERKWRRETGIWRKVIS